MNPPNHRLYILNPCVKFTGALDPCAFLFRSERGLWPHDRVSDKQAGSNGKCDHKHLDKLLLARGDLPHGNGGKAPEPDAAAHQQDDSRQQRYGGWSPCLSGQECLRRPPRRWYRKVSQLRRRGRPNRMPPWAPAQPTDRCQVKDADRSEKPRTGHDQQRYKQPEPCGAHRRGRPQRESSRRGPPAPHLATRRQTALSDRPARP